MPILRIADTNFKIFAAIMCKFTALSEATGCKKVALTEKTTQSFSLNTYKIRKIKFLIRQQGRVKFRKGGFSS